MKIINKNIDYNIREEEDIHIHDEKRMLELRNYYCGTTESVCTDSEKYNQLVNEDQETEKDRTENINCKICQDKYRKNSNYIILSCNHIFHVNCLAETHYNDVYKYHIIDGDFLNSRKCVVCNNGLLTEELMFLHSKFLSSTKENMQTHQEKMNQLENKLKNIKDELRICYEYKNKLEREREKSKQIVSTLSTML
jgi:hypothetical protein